MTMSKLILLPALMEAVAADADKVNPAPTVLITRAAASLLGRTNKLLGWTRLWLRQAHKPGSLVSWLYLVFFPG